LVVSDSGIARMKTKNNFQKVVIDFEQRTVM